MVLFILIALLAVPDNERQLCGDYLRIPLRPSLTDPSGISRLVLSDGKASVPSQFRSSYSAKLNRTRSVFELATILVSHVFAAVCVADLIQELLSD